jgi:hypothetical protein
MVTFVSESRFHSTGFRLISPLNLQGGMREPIGAPDSVVLTGGVHLFVGSGVLQVGVATPVTGPKLFDLEAIAQLNYRF